MDTGDGVIPLLIANRPILKVADATMRGYRRLQDQEDAFRVETFIQHPELVGCWIHYLDLFDAAIETQNANPLDPDPPTPEEDYALQLLSRDLHSSGRDLHSTGATSANLQGRFRKLIPEHVPYLAIQLVGAKGIGRAVATSPARRLHHRRTS